MSGAKPLLTLHVFMTWTVATLHFTQKTYVQALTVSLSTHHKDMRQNATHFGFSKQIKIEETEGRERERERQTDDVCNKTRQ